MFNELIVNPNAIVGHVLENHTIIRWLASDKDSLWYEAENQFHERRIVYLFQDNETRDARRTRIHRFIQSADSIIKLRETEALVPIIIGTHRTILDHPTREYLTSERTRPRTIADYNVVSVLGTGYKSVTYLVNRSSGLGTNYAMKLTIAEEYESTTAKPEIERMCALANEDRDHFPHVHGDGKVEIDVAMNTRQFVYLIQDYIKGPSLAQLIERHPERLTVTFIETFLRELLSALTVLEDLGLMHDDLHDENIIIHGKGVACRPYIIDFGSAKTKGPSQKMRDDLRNVAGHVARLLNIVTDRQVARSPYEDAVLTACEALLTRLADDDPLRGPDSAAQALFDFDTYFPRGTVRQTLKRPFDFGNAEEVLDNQLLQQLAAKSYPWRARIESSANLLLIGPRGCGKTTVFRSMSFNCLAEAGRLSDALDKPYIGLYISCNREFRLRFSALEPGLLESRDDDIRHYFNLLILREVLGVMDFLAAENRIGPRDIRTILAFVRDVTRLNDILGEDRKALINATGETVRLIEHVRFAIWNNAPCDASTTQSMVADLAQILSQQIGSTAGKTLYLFVDDYTERKVPRAAQRAINHIIFVPNALYKCKISSEVFGVPPDQVFGAFLDQDRDYKELNLGTLYYTNLPPPAQKEFLREIVDTRLALCQFEGKVQDIIGDSEYPAGSLSLQLKAESDARAAARNNQRKSQSQSGQNADEVTVARDNSAAYYHGWDTICDLCTGDISNILELMNRMYEQYDVSRNSLTKISPARQDFVIQRYSAQYINKIKGVPRYGERLFGLVDAFGSMAQRLLREHPYLDLKDGRMEPYRVLRIELDEGYVDRAQAALSMDVEQTDAADADLLWMLLQRYCIFIDADESRSRRNTLASKVVMRRIFCPAFKIALSSRESFTQNKQSWELFCADPKTFTERYVRNVLSNEKNKHAHLAQGVLDY